MSRFKSEAHSLVNLLTDEATWDDLLRLLSVRQAIEQGIADGDAGHVIPVDEVRARLGLLGDRRGDS